MLFFAMTKKKEIGIIYLCPPHYGISIFIDNVNTKCVLPYSHFPHHERYERKMFNMEQEIEEKFGRPKKADFLKFYLDTCIFHCHNLFIQKSVNNIENKNEKLRRKNEGKGGRE